MASERFMKNISLRFGGYQSEASVHTRAARVFTAAFSPDVDVATTADVTQQGHAARDLLAMVEGEELDFCYFASSYLAGRVPRLGVFDLPFRIAERERIYAKLDGALGAELTAGVAAATGFYVLGFWDNGFRHISNRLRPIHRPEDCRGMRIRTLDNAFHKRIFAAIGFDPVVIDVKELAEAVATRQVDAQENPLTNVVNFGLHRTHRHVSLTSHFFGVTLLLVNRRRFDAWPQETRDRVRSAAATATKAQRGFAAAEGARCLALLEADGVEIVPAQRVDRVAFRAAAAAIVADEVARIGAELVAELENEGG
jgi:TRAP-type C4-dicarboxylate transport system substrate-binding protein